MAFKFCLGILGFSDSLIKGQVSLVHLLLHVISGGGQDAIDHCSQIDGVFAISLSFQDIFIGKCLPVNRSNRTVRMKEDKGQLRILNALKVWFWKQVLSSVKILISLTYVKPSCKPLREKIWRLYKRNTDTVAPHTICFAFSSDFEKSPCNFWMKLALY